MTRIAVIAQTADPARGSEFATGWGAVRRLYFDHRVLSRASVDIFISENRGNRANILGKLEGINPRPRMIFVPQVAPRAHRALGRVMRVAWQHRVYKRIRAGAYDVVHQVSPNSVAYLNPIFLRMHGPTRVVGPMRIAPRASVSGLYWRDPRTLWRHLAIHTKEAIEFVVFARRRRAVRRWMAVHLSPFAGNSHGANELYCRETAFLVPPASGREAESGGPWTVVWSGLGDRLRKNQHLAGRVVDAALGVSALRNVCFSLIGWRGAGPASPRVRIERELPRDRFLARLGPRTVYMCTSLLELNSVLAEEVLVAGGRVVAGPLPSFQQRESDRITCVEAYDDPEKWAEALVQAVRPQPTARPEVQTSHGVVEDIVQRILALIAQEEGAGPCS